MLVGYMRVSSDSDRQTTDLQRDALLSAGVDSRHLTNLAAGDTSVGSTPRTGTSTPNDPSATQGTDNIRVEMHSKDRLSTLAWR